MKATIDVDIGGTFTDVFIGMDDKTVFGKTPTTGYDLSVGFMRALKDAASRLELSLGELLKATEAIRYSTTIAMNTLIQRKGPKLGLILTAGHEDVIPVGRGGSWGDGLTYSEIRKMPYIEKPEPLISRELTVGIKERNDYMGNMVRPLDEDDLREKLHYLVDRGARGFVVSLLYSYLTPANEKRVREIIREEYPEVYLGSMPVILSSEVLPKRLEYQRTNAAILNAYLHGAMSDELSGMGDELRSMGYEKPLLMVHNNGGIAEVFHTQALQTYNGGPVAGIIGSAHLGSLLNYDNVMVADVGGTSFDIGLVVSGSPRFYAFNPLVDRWAVDITMFESMSIGAGGGSIAWINRMLGNRIEVGPQSAGSMPGPACYNQGGTEPTVTDADVVLGYVNPDYFHGGKMRLDRGKASEAIEEKVAKPLGIGVEAAALLIKEVVDGKAASILYRETVLKGFDPKNFVLFAYGGGGPSHCCGYGFPAGFKKIVTFPFSPVFCAFGSSLMDIGHIYEQSRRIPLLHPMGGGFGTEYDEFNESVKELRQKALEELADEGLPLDDIIFRLELEMKYGGVMNVLRVETPHMSINSEDDVRSIYETFEREYGEVYSPFATNPEGGVDIEGFALRATIRTPKREPPVYEFDGEEPRAEAIKGKRRAYWEEYDGFHDTAVFEQGLLRRGNIIGGPAIIEAEDTTTVLPPGSRLTVNRYHGCEIEKTQEVEK